MDARTLCLAALSYGDASGYETRKRISDWFGHFARISTGALYPALGALLARDHIVCVAGGDGPLERRTYRLTSSGAEALLAALRDGRETERSRSDFLAKMFFAEHLDSNDVQRLIDSRLAALRGEQGDLNRLPISEMNEGQRFTLRYALAIRRAAIEFLQHEGRVIATAIDRNKQ
ncbi:MAG: hypothetical protein HOL85_15650 [Rhodospirillaceae bacterium]|jgi:PadR family transcriptional regulator, regulatory protein AphA|nr:hypothetical protein [Rhodospirillaceae bacterium]